MRTQNCAARMTSCDASSSEYGSVAECQLSNGGSHATGRQAWIACAATLNRNAAIKSSQQNAMNAWDVRSAVGLRAKQAPLNPPGRPR